MGYGEQRAAQESEATERMSQKKTFLGDERARSSKLAPTVWHGELPSAQVAKQGADLHASRICARSGR